MNVAVQSDDTTMDGNEALVFVEGLAEKVAGHDYTLSDSENSALSSIRKFVDRLLKDIVTQRDEDQKEVNSIKDLIEGCATSATNSLKQVAALKIAVGTARTQHSNCRVSETKANDRMTLDCAAYDAYCQGKGSDVPACLSSMTSAKFSTGNANSDKSLGSSLEEINEWFPPLWEKYAQCKLSEGIHNDKTKECNQDQKSFEGDFCQYDLLLDTTCDTQDDCRSKNIDAREKGHAAVKIAETARSTDCQVGHKVKCLLAIFEEKDNKKKPGMLDSCKSAKYTCPDGINYPGIPDPTTCTREPSEPCDSSWLQKEYTSQAWYGKAPTGKCTQCLKPGSEAIFHFNGNDAKNGKWRDRVSNKELPIPAKATIQQGYLNLRGDAMVMPLRTNPKWLPSVTYAIRLRINKETKNLGWVMSQSPDYGWSRALAVSDSRLGGLGQTPGTFDSGLGKVPIKQWFILVGVWTQNGHCQTWLNGKAGKERTCRNGEKDGGDDQIVIGGRGGKDAGHNPPDMDVSHAFVYDKALSDDEIQHLVQSLSEYD